MSSSKISPMEMHGFLLPLVWRRKIISHLKQHQGLMQKKGHIIVVAAVKSILYSIYSEWKHVSLKWMKNAMSKMIPCERQCSLNRRVTDDQMLQLPLREKYLARCQRISVRSTPDLSSSFRNPWSCRIINNRWPSIMF